MLLKGLLLNKQLNFYFIYFQQITVIAAIFLLLIFIITVFINKFNVKQFILFNNYIKYCNIFLITVVFICLFFRFYLHFFFYKFELDLFESKYTDSLTITFFNSNLFFNLNNSALSDCIILLSLSSGIVSVYLLGEKSITKHFSNISVFCVFLFTTILMVYTTNLLVMFISFEFLFLPTLYFAYTYGYIQKSDKTVEILLFWTLFGSFLVFLSISYIFIKYKTLDFNVLINLNFSTYESVFIYLCIFFGFGFKMPISPFHYWLTKVHVEATAGFSIFLSGFLVKTSLYCFYQFHLLFHNVTLMQITSVIALLGVIEASLKMWSQADIKKLIAYATIQEMNLILYFLINYQNILDINLIAFILMHGLLSSLMFFVVDLIQQKTSSRSIITVSGLALSLNSLKYIIWFMILTFTGFPLTLKFYVEWTVLSIILQEAGLVYVIFLIFVTTFGGLGFTKNFMLILYSQPDEKLEINKYISKKDSNLIYFLIYTLTIFNIVAVFF